MKQDQLLMDIILLAKEDTLGLIIDRMNMKDSQSCGTLETNTL